MKDNDLDYLTFILTKNGTEAFPIPTEDGGEKGFIAGIPKVIYDLEQIIKKPFKATKYKFSKYENEEIFIQERSKDFIVQLRGYFFLLPDYEKKLAKIINSFKNNAYTFHLTRIDWAFSLNIPHQDFSQLLSNSKVDDFLTMATYSKKNSFTYISIFHSRLKAVCYNKAKLLKSKKTNFIYRELYKLKYGEAETRFEIRISGKDTLSKMTEVIIYDLEDFLDLYRDFVGQYFSQRIGLLRELEKFLPLDQKDKLYLNEVCNP